MINPIINVFTSLDKNHAIGGIRISLGEKDKYLRLILNRIFKKDYLFPRYMTNIKIYNKNTILEKGIVCLFPSPNSFNGETIIEIYINGNIYLLKNILKLIKNKLKIINTKYSKPGEFTKRGFLNNKINLLDIYKINNVSNNNLENIFKQIKEKIINIIIVIEAKILLDKIGNSIIKKKLFKLIKLCKKYIKKKTVKIIITGECNVGKSTLFNKIIKKRYSIISKIKGTTNNITYKRIKLNNISIEIYDTPGIRKTKNKIEQMGIRKTIKLIKNSDLVIRLYGINYKNASLEKLLLNINKINVLTKIDRIKKKSYINNICISNKNNIGFNRLIRIIKSKIKNIYDYNKVNGFKYIFKKLIKILYKVTKIINIDYYISKNLLNRCLKLISLGSINNNKYLDKIFKNFCIGK